MSSRGHVAASILEIIQKAGQSAREDRQKEELDWLGGEVAKHLALNNYRFFRWIAERRDSAGFFKWILCLSRNTQDFSWIIREARKVYGAGVPPFQPTLLEIINRFDWRKT